VSPLVLPLANALGMLALPVAVAAVAVRRGPVAPLFVGALAFLGSQVVHLPLNALILPRLAVPEPVLFAFLGLSAGLCEETSRWLALRLSPDARSWRGALALSAGHGGIESVALGAVVLLAVFSPGFEPATGPGALLGAVERAGTLGAHIGLSALVAHGYRKRQLRWLFAAILWHASLDGGVLALARHLGVWPAEGLVLAQIPLAIAVAVAVREPQTAAPTSIPPVALTRRPLA
jgi:uncharacterized membrane protein YhfC